MTTELKRKIECGDDVPEGTTESPTKKSKEGDVNYYHCSMFEQFAGTFGFEYLHGCEDKEGMKMMIDEEFEFMMKHWIKFDVLGEKMSKNERKEWKMIDNRCEGALSTIYDGLNGCKKEFFGHGIDDGECQFNSSQSVDEIVAVLKSVKWGEKTAWDYLQSVVHRNVDEIELSDEENSDSDNEEDSDSVIVDDHHNYTGEVL